MTSPTRPRTPPIRIRLTNAINRDSAAAISSIIEDAARLCSSNRPQDVERFILGREAGGKGIALMAACGSGRWGRGSPRMLQRWCRWWPGDPSLPTVLAKAASMERFQAMNHIMHAVKACGPDQCLKCCFETPEGSLPGWALMQLANSASPSENACQLLFETAVERNRDDVMAASIRVHTHMETERESRNKRWVLNLVENCA